MPIDWPASPSTNDIYSFGGRSWQYNGVAWVPAPQTVSTLVNLEGRAYVKGGSTGVGGPQSLEVENDIKTWRPAENSGDAGAMFMNSGETAYVYWDGTDFKFYAGSTDTKGKIRHGYNGRRAQSEGWVSSSWNNSGSQGNAAVLLTGSADQGFTHDGNTAWYVEDAGTYLITTGGLISTGGTSAAYFGPGKNGSLINSYAYVAASQLSDASVSQVVTLASGDYVQCIFFSMVANCTLFGTGHSHFTVHRLD